MKTNLIFLLKYDIQKCSDDDLKINYQLLIDDIEKGDRRNIHEKINVIFHMQEHYLTSLWKIDTVKWNEMRALFSSTLCFLFKFYNLSDDEIRKIFIPMHKGEYYK